MTLDEAIKHCENVAAKCFVERSARNHSGKCGFEHLELAEWLKDYKRLKEKDEARMVRYEGDGYADGEMVYDCAFCPNCDHEIEVDSENWGCMFCPECGQRLRWEK